MLRPARVVHYTAAVVPLASERLPDVSFIGHLPTPPQPPPERNLNHRQTLEPTTTRAHAHAGS
jgi:hypothetical protein